VDFNKLKDSNRPTAVFETNVSGSLFIRDEAKETLEDIIEVAAYILDLRSKWFLLHLELNL
jgi:hypothetical protein